MGQRAFESAPPVGPLDVFSARDAAPHGGGGFFLRDHGSASATASVARDAARVRLHRPEETDIYVVEGERLYVLNAYRGLMVFDISDLDDPRLLGRSPVDGLPVDMLVRNGVATMVVDDHHRTPGGWPSHGSVVRTIDARDPATMKVEGEVSLDGSPRDTRVVGDKLLVLSETSDGPYINAFNGPGGRASRVIVSSVSVGSRAPTLSATREVDGRGGVFHVTPNAILLAYDVTPNASQRSTPPIGRHVIVQGGPSWSDTPAKSALDYIAISPLDGRITHRGSFWVDGALNRGSSDEGRASVVLEDDTASILTCKSASCAGDRGYTLTTVDFSKPRSPVQLAAVDLAPKGWGPTALFSGTRMYLASREGTWSTRGENTSIEVYDLTNPAAPALAGAVEVRGVVSRLVPLGADRLLVLGNEYNYATTSNDVAVRLLDVSDATRPSELATSTFGGDWTTPRILGVSESSTRDDGRKLIALPFSGKSASSDEYVSGVQLVEHEADRLTTRGAAHAEGWTKRGVFLKNRLVSLSDESLNVIDFTDRERPRVVRALTLARDVVSAQPSGATIAQVSADWGHELPRSELRVLPVANAEENVLEPNAPTVSIDGSDAQLFRNGDLAYVVTTVESKLSRYAMRSVPRVQVVDLSSGEPTLKGALDLPEGSRPSRWAGHRYWTWHDTSNIVQVGGSALAFRRMGSSTKESAARREEEREVYVVDLSDPDNPRLSSAAVAPDVDTWWGNLKVVGSTLYATHYEHTGKPVADPDPTAPGPRSRVSYYLDRIDLTDRAHPTVTQRINVPGLLVGASDADPSLLYFVDYRWHDDYAIAQKNELAVARIVGNEAHLESTTPLDGWVGNVFVRGTRAYASAQEYPRPSLPGEQLRSPVTLLEIDLSEPTHPVARASTPDDGWGWLVDVEGDRAILTSRWGDEGLDVYALRPGEVPTYVQFIRTGPWLSDIARHDGELYLSTGYRGLQKISRR
ncbi:MAG: beta-propeller domain-containing protein [Labilithrix sp.]|nr:beta-propeller domain-containing protein [Labilithrix sp.]